MQTFSNVLNLMKMAMLPVLLKAEVVVDATAGNGHDTLFLAEHMPQTAHLYAFDVQAEAIAATKERTKAFAERITYLQQGHETIGEVIPAAIDVAMFNLGYLPGQEHALTTRHETTRKAVGAVLEKLSLHGICAIAVYPGHAEGKVEAAMLMDWLQTLPTKNYTVGCYRLLNHKDTAPYALLIERTDKK